MTTYVVQKKVVRRGRQGGGHEWFALAETQTRVAAEDLVAKAPAGVYRVVPLSLAMGLSDAMVRALDDFAAPGGHGYGDGAYLSRATAHALQGRGLIELSVRRPGGGVMIGWGTATDDGRDALQRIRGR